MKVSKEYFRGCLLGGATADAKSYGVREAGKDLISDNTQLTSFTLDGLVWADDRAINRGIYAYVPCLFYSYQKWYYTQTGNLADKAYEFILKGEILEWEELFARRGAGETSVSTLGGCIANSYGTLKNRINNANGCGGIVRVAPIGMYFWNNPEMAFRIGSESAALTHGHTNAILAAGFFAAFLAGIFAGAEPKAAALAALELLKCQEGHEACAVHIERAVKLAPGNRSVLKCMESIGDGYLSEEAVALAVFLTLRYRNDFDGAINVATGFDGNKDSLPPMVGNALGAYLGLSAIPQKWLNTIELYELIVHGADLLLERVDIEDAEGGFAPESLVDEKTN
ncbi:MAG: ADP-ribosylglycohydrolase family protein [Clostridiales Family XIII bacterium]|jgi:ADP-ribosylglycohydrolase|nr:ADP-ribosylglycohydrolase family protein [Clostridiales Family XIII bacterium]